MFLSIHINAVGSFIGSILILIFALYSLIYINAFRTDRIVADFFTLQISLFIFLFGNAMYVSGNDPSYVLFWTKICYIGAASTIVTSYRFSETIVEKRNIILCRSLEVFTALVLLMIILPGQYLFTNQLNTLKSHSSVVKGPFFPYMVISILILVAFFLGRLSYFILSDKERRKGGSPIIIGLILWFIGTAYDGIFAAILSKTRPQLWIGPTIMAFCLALFTTKIAEHRHNEIERIKSEKEKIYNNLIHDKVSGIFTREYIYESLIQRISQQERNMRKDSLVFLDIDNFKLLNDELEHKTGDQILGLLGKVFENNTRQGDIPARLGGDEFLILLDDCDETGALSVMENIKKLFDKELHKTLDYWKNNNMISLSIGIVTNIHWGDNPEDIIHKADLAMYRSKRDGKNRISIYDTQMEAITNN